MGSIDEHPRKIHSNKGFHNDFGFFECTSRSPSSNKTYFHGYGDGPWVYCLSAGDQDKFGGAGFVVESLDNLEYTAKILPEATAIYRLKDAPGEEKGVTFKDLVDGWPMHLVWGQEERKLDLDDDHSFPRIDFDFINCYLFDARPQTWPLRNSDERFYEDIRVLYFRFNLVASDLLHTPEGHNVIAFNRIDRSPTTLVDHHPFFFFEGPVSHVHYSSFETTTSTLKYSATTGCAKKSTRHIMGSQIFAYWFDPSKFILEHYVDGDLMDNKEPTNVSVSSNDNLVV
ncbi:related to 2,3-dihydroxybiphenyl-1,2-dioxygenase [Phialocephala subalpina]|uniref:Related to 2,3-dihydroxybiphenyl-1,2-dioxygenase n=1 Tax=Phialocephala subalpina TaxID=576137 RepID=A0A1L7XHE5_9HELO|nr:related to 2,3-dihydroxybiphenyl-1,2-dioxygenase [Phialocephala subalpina]